VGVDDGVGLWWHVRAWRQTEAKQLVGEEVTSVDAEELEAFRNDIRDDAE